MLGSIGLFGALHLTSPPPTVLPKIFELKALGLDLLAM